MYIYEKGEVGTRFTNALEAAFITLPEAIWLSMAARRREYEQEIRRSREGLFTS